MPSEGWECPTCQRCFAPFVESCYKCGPRRDYEKLDPYIPRGRRRELLDALHALAGHGDPEAAHFDADQALLRYIDDPAISQAFDAVPA